MEEVKVGGDRQTVVIDFGRPEDVSEVIECRWDGDEADGENDFALVTTELANRLEGVIDIDIYRRTQSDDDRRDNLMSHVVKLTETSVIQCCAWVQFFWPDPTRLTELLTRFDPIRPVADQK